MLKESHQNCIICGSLNPNSLGLFFEMDSELSVIGYFKGKSGLQGYDDILHGGVISSLLDSAMVHCLSKLGIVGVTAELNVRFVDEIPIDRDLTIKAIMVENRGLIYKLISEIFLDGKIVARGRAKFVERRL